MLSLLVQNGPSFLVTFYNLSAILIVLWLKVIQGDNIETDASVRVLAGYLPDYRFYINVNATATHLTDLILFSVSPNPIPSLQTLSSGCCLNHDQYKIARQARAYKQEHATNDDTPKLKLWLTVGGGGRSQHFFQQPGKLTKALKELALEQQLDGIDVDCEEFSNQQHYRKYMSWINASAPFWKKSGLLVSVALHAGQVMFPDVYEVVDRVNLMAYDLPGPYHADPKAVRQALDALIESGCPTDKIVMGIPAYARHSENPGMVKTFAEIVDEMENSNGSLDGMGQWNGYQVESPDAVQDKVELARTLNLAGIFFWELGQDKQHTLAPGGILLHAAAAQRGTYISDGINNEL